MWRVEINHPFLKERRWWFGLNDRIIREARIRGVKRFIIKVGNMVEKMVAVPTEKELEVKEWKNEYEERPSKFAGLPSWKIYHFKV